MWLMIGIYIFILGLIVGSFLNVCIYRLPRGESVVMPPSHCTACGEKLSAKELVPVLSYLLLGRKCGHCGEKISPRYAIVELLTGILFFIAYQGLGLSMLLVFALVLVSVLLVVTFVDLEFEIIPDEAVIVALIAGILLAVYNLFWPVPVYGDRIWWNPLLGLLVGSGFLLLVAVLGRLFYRTEEVMGMGDIKLLAPIGMLLGWRLTLLALLLAVFLGGMTGIVLLISGVKKRKSTIPFGPFIAVGTYIALIWGWNLLHWYFGLFAL